MQESTDDNTWVLRKDLIEKLIFNFPVCDHIRNVQLYLGHSSVESVFDGESTGLEIVLAHFLHDFSHYLNFFFKAQMTLIMTVLSHHLAVLKLLWVQTQLRWIVLCRSWKKVLKGNGLINPKTNSVYSKTGGGSKEESEETEDGACDFYFSGSSSISASILIYFYSSFLSHCYSFLEFYIF